jgi:hypothetical protein
MSIIKKFNDFNKTTESSILKEPVEQSLNMKEPTIKSSDRTPNPRIKRKENSSTIKKPLIEKPTIKNPVIKVENVENKNKEDKLTELFNNIEFINKVAIFKDTIHAKDAYLFLESAKIDKNKLWYFIMDRNEDTIQVVKYNNKEGFILNEFVDELFKYYKTNKVIEKYITENLKISGGKEFVVISNISPILKSILKTDLVKLLSK